MTTIDTRSPAHDDAHTEALLVRAAGGDRDAFAEFYDVTSPRIYALLRAVADVPTAGSLLEGVYVDAWQRLRRRGAPSFPAVAWVSIIAHRHTAASAA